MARVAKPSVGTAGPTLAAPPATDAAAGAAASVAAGPPLGASPFIMRLEEKREA